MLHTPILLPYQQTYINVLDASWNYIASVGLKLTNQTRGWVEIDLSNYNIQVGPDFYILIWPGWIVDKDTSPPSTGRSYEGHAAPPGNIWPVSENVMIRAKVTPPDGIPPTTEISLSGSPGDSGWYLSDVQVAFNAYDNPGGSGVNKIEYSFDGTHWNTYGASFVISTEGTTTVYYRSTDNAGNVEPTKTETIKIDKLPPQILITSPEAKDYLSTEKITINFAAQDNISGIATATANIDGVPVTNGQEINLKTLSLGPHTFIASSLDQAGNRAEKSVIFNVVPVPFSSFSAKVEAEIGSEITENKLEAKGNFTLGEASDGIKPVNENVALSFFDVFFEIPAGSFKWFEHPKKPEKSEWRFEGMIDNLPIEMKIKPLGNNSYEFKFESESLNLCWLKSQIELGLKIGDDFGKIEVVPEIKGLENWENICAGESSPEIETPGISPD